MRNRQKMDDFQEKLASMQGRHIKTIDEFNRNIQLQQERSQKALLDLSKKFNDQLEQAQANAPRTPRPSSRGTILQNHAPPLSNASPTSSYLDSSKTKKQEKPLSPPPKPITPARQRQKSLIKPEEIPERKPSIATATEVRSFFRK